MAREKEEGVEQTPRQETSGISVPGLLQGLIGKTGLTIPVQGCETPVFLKGGEITDVKVDSAWVRFSIDGCCLRTLTIQDRNSFLAWLESDRKQKPTAQFYRVHGQLPKPADEIKQPGPAIPTRSRAHEATRRIAYVEMQQQLGMNG